MARLLVVGLVLTVCVSTAQAFEMEMVTVGDPGNVDGTHGDGYGGVDYIYRIGKYEVTNTQYCEFLNAVARSDPHDLYNTNMGGGLGGITRDGSEGSYTYSTR